MKKGIFIAFEGGEGGGKSTQIERLAAYLRSKGHDVLVTKEPGDGDPGIRQKLLHPSKPLTREEELDLFCEDRQLHIRNWVIPALEGEKIVLCDRFEPSTKAYQGYGRGMSLELIDQKSRGARGSVYPQLIILLDLPPEVGLARGKGDTSFEKEKLDFHQRVRRGFLEQAKSDPSRWRVVDATRPLEEVWEDIKDAVLEIIR